ncbi:MAG: phosphate signaling complex protein PhoU [Phycisphaerae bacterium]|nr:phosphate signaling complex protein PhoU [Phycisphaerae bacterium]
MVTFHDKLSELRTAIVGQGDRVLDLTLKAVESFFDLDVPKAATIAQLDDAIDRVDVEIERASIPLLAMGPTDPYDIRSVLTIVKVNNELERVADCGVNIAEVVLRDGKPNERIPETFRVMANSVIGMLRDAIRSLATSNPSLAQQVLLFDDTVAGFKEKILLDAQEKVAKGTFTVTFAFRLLAVTKALERIADHCTNISEQVIYLESGRIVRHRPEGWTAPLSPDA